MKLLQPRPFAAALCLLPVLTSGCGQSGESAPAEERSASPAGRVDLGGFVARVSPRRGTITFERVARPRSAGAPGAGTQSLDEITLFQDDVEGSTTVQNSVELVTHSTGVDGACPAGFQSGTFCGNVTLRAFFPARALNNVYVQVTKITDSDGQDLGGHGAVNSDAPFVVNGTTLLANGLGLWRYTGSGVQASGVLAQDTATNGGGNAGTRDWVFANPDGADTNVYIHVFATLTYAGYTFSALNAGLPAIHNACTQGGTKHLGPAGGIAMAQINVPFPFTLYGTTYSPGTPAGKITLTRRAGIGFGALSTAVVSAYNTGANVALPSAAASTFKPGIYPFWEDLNYTTENATVTNSPSGLCSLVSGSEPNRALVLTWHDMKYFGNTSAIYPGTPTMNISAVLHEGSDVIDFIYGVMTTNPVSRANGSMATIGVQNETGLVATAKNSVPGGSVPINTNVALGSFYTLTPNP